MSTGEEKRNDSDHAYSGAFIIDASVLIDFLGADEEILRISSAVFAEVAVISDTISKVRQLDSGRAAQLGLVIIQPEESHYESVDWESGLAADDQLELMLAAERNYTCVTNDRPMHMACDQQGIRHIWGLDLLLDLVRCNAISRERARTVGETLYESNIKITDEIFNRYVDALDEIGS